MPCLVQNAAADFQSPSSALLSHRFKEDSCNCGREIQAARPVHRDCDAIVDVSRKQSLRQPLRFAAEDEKIVSIEACAFQLSIFK